MAAEIRQRPRPPRRGRRASMRPRRMAAEIDYTLRRLFMPVALLQ